MKVGLIKNGYNLTLGKPERWIDKSDHVPIILEIQDLCSRTEIQNTFIDFTKRHLSDINQQTKTKFESELKTIENLAVKLDLRVPSDKEKMTLIDKIETIKNIDKLTTRLKKNEC